MRYALLLMLALITVAHAALEPGEQCAQVTGPQVIDKPGAYNFACGGAITGGSPALYVSADDVILENVVISDAHRCIEVRGNRVTVRGGAHTNSHAWITGNIHQSSVHAAGNLDVFRAMYEHKLSLLEASFLGYENVYFATGNPLMRPFV